MKHATFTALDYIADQLFQADMRKLNGSGGTHWWCAREDLREHWRAEARRLVDDWALLERKTKRTPDGLVVTRKRQVRSDRTRQDQK